MWCQLASKNFSPSVLMDVKAGWLRVGDASAVTRAATPIYPIMVSEIVMARWRVIRG
jgi:hypothetical protein